MDHPAGDVVDPEAEIILRGSRSIVVSNLTRVLDRTPAGGDPAERIAAVLGQVGWFSSRPAEPTAAEAWLAGDGVWRLGPLEGRAEPVQPASYLGATARELAKQRAIERLESDLTDTAGKIRELDEALDRNRDAGVLLEREAAGAPDEQAVLRAVTHLETLLDALAKLISDLEKLERQFRDEETPRDETWSAATTYAAEHVFRLDDLDGVADALGRYRQALERFNGNLRLLEAAQVAFAKAEERAAGAGADLASDERELQAAGVERDKLKIEVRVAKESIDQDAQQQLTMGEWRPFDARRHGEKSGGEKVVLLAQPLFAAAVVAYGSASQLAPRIVWLDEAMTGVDEDAKASFMGLTVELDLDVMLTAHDEWCTYETVPLVAIYDLARVRYTAGVDLLPFLWSGGELVEVVVPSESRLPSVADDLLSLEPT